MWPIPEPFFMAQQNAAVPAQPYVECLVFGARSTFSLGPMMTDRFRYEPVDCKALIVRILAAETSLRRNQVVRNLGLPYEGKY